MYVSVIYIVFMYTALFRIEPYFLNKYTNGIVRLESADKLQNERWVWQKKFYRIIVDGITLRLFPACFLFCCGTAFPCRLVIRDRPLRGVAGYNKWHSTTKKNGINLIIRMLN